MKSQNRLLYAVFLSLLIHFTFVVGSRLVPPSLPVAKETIEFKVLNSKSDRKTKMIVRADDVPKYNESTTSDDPLTFLSEKTQRVKEQLRAIKSGLTKNRSNTVASQQQKTDNGADKSNSSAKNDPSGLKQFVPQMKTGLAQQARQQNRNWEPESGFSTVSNALPDQIKVGDITSLNTDRYLFYSYYARAEELYRNQWEPLLDAMVYNPPPRLLSVPRNKYTTVVEAWFKPSGEVHSVYVLKESGVPEFDRAAAEAFRRTGMIPNPPKEKIDPDGYIRIKWGLTVNFDPRALVRK